MSHRDLAEAAWRWVLDQVRLGADPELAEPGMHSGAGGLVHALARVALVRPWTDEESALAAAVGEQVLARRTDDVTWFDGLVSDIGVLSLLGLPTDGPVARLLELGPADWGWVDDATLGTGALVQGGLTAGSAELTAYGAGLLLKAAEETPAGLDWPFIRRDHVPPERLDAGRVVQMPNFSHGVAGVATVLARAGVALSRSDLVEAARLGAEHLVTLASPASLEVGGFAVPRRIPPKAGEDDFTWSWCHGPAGTMALFEALDAAGVELVAGEPPAAWVARCLRSLRTSGIPERRHPGFWDNDGRCCGTAGVGSAVLPHDAAFATVLADALAARAYVEHQPDGDRAWWRFVEHRAAEPLLPPSAGWMQGTAGIAGFLFEHTAASRPRPA